MKPWLDSGYELDDDPGRIDRHLVHRFLSAESYWAKGRSREGVGTTLRNASRLIGVYSLAGEMIAPAGEMVGFCPERSPPTASTASSASGSLPPGSWSAPGLNFPDPPGKS